MSIKNVPRCDSGRLGLLTVAPPGDNKIVFISCIHCRSKHVIITQKHLIKFLHKGQPELQASHMINMAWLHEEHGAAVRLF